MAQQQQASPLPKLTAFLRGGAEPRGAEKRRHPSTADSMNQQQQQMSGLSDQHSQPMYGHENAAFDPNPRQRRRSNIFAQYGDEHYPQQVPPFDSRCTPPPPPNLHGTRSLSALHPPRESIHMYTNEQRSVRSAHGYPQDASRIAQVNASNPPKAMMPQEPAQRERTSRYLSEADRRAIILRIDNGEKQVALAKEFLVSRAAICNLYKNRHEVLTRAERNPTAKHPKRQKERGTPKTDASTEPALAEAVATDDKETSDGAALDDDPMSDEHSSTESDVVKEQLLEPPPAPPLQQQAQDGPTSLQTPRVYDGCALSYPIRRMISVLRNPMLSLATYRQVSKRLTRSVVEEVVACLPQQRVKIPTASGHALTSILPLCDDHVCGISVEHQSTRMLQAFTDVFPGASTTALSLERLGNQSPVNAWAVQGGHFPPVDTNKLVLLFATYCSTGSRVCAALEHLVAQARVNPSSIYVATLLSSRPGINRVHSRFPGVTILSGVIDEALDERGHIVPGIGDTSTRAHFAPPAFR